MIEKIKVFYKKYRTYLQMLFSGLLILFVFSKVNFHDIVSKLSEINFQWFIVCLVINLYIIWNQSMRWRDLLIQNSHFKVPRLFFVWLTFEGYFFNFFLPSSIGGDVVKAYKLGNKGIGKYNAAAATFLSRIFGVFVLCLFFWVGMVFFPKAINSFFLIIIIFVSIVAFSLGILLLVQRRFTVPKQFNRLFDTIESYKGQWKLFGTTLLKTIIMQLCVLATQYAYFKCINIDISIDALLLYVPVINIVTMFPISFNGIGIREWVIAETFAKIPGISVESCMASMAIAYAIVFLVAGIGAICHFIPLPSAWRVFGEDQLRKNQSE